jgi:hypothetical protein
LKTSLAWLLALAASAAFSVSGCILSNFEIEDANAMGGTAGGGTAGATYAGTGSAGIGGSAGGVTRISQPELSDDEYVMVQGTALERDAASGLLANDTPVSLHVTGFSNSDPSRPRAFDAELMVAADGSFHFAPPPRFFGRYHFSYTAENVVGQSASADVEIRVLPSEIDLDAIIEGIGGYVLYGVNGEALGSAIDGASDVNGDGRADVLIGAPGANAGDGAAFVVFGKDDLESVEVKPLLADSDEQRFVSLQGATGEGLGSSVAGLGDVDGDGAGDLAIGSSTAPGRVHFLFARDLGVTNVVPLAHEYSVVGDSAKVGVAALLRGGGDVNGDAVPDSLLSSVNGDTGWLHVPFGNRTRAGELGVTALPSAVVRGEAALDAFPLDAAFVGDLDGDGADEVLAASDSAFYLFRSGMSFPANAGATTVNGSRGGYRARRAAPGPASVAGLGDVNGDGVRDLAYCDGTTLCAVLLGPVSTLTQATPVSGFRRKASRLSVRGGDDVDGDSLKDLLFSDDGSAYLVYGDRAGLAPTNVAALGAQGFSVRAAAGGSITAATLVGDVNGDHFADIAIADANADAGSGRVYIVFGMASR